MSFSFKDYTNAIKHSPLGYVDDGIALNVPELKMLYDSSLNMSANRVLAKAKKTGVRRELSSVFLPSTGNVMWL